MCLYGFLVLFLAPAVYGWNITGAEVNRESTKYAFVSKGSPVKFEVR
jgi:hypothetical protein